MDWLSAAASIATALGLLVVVFQLFLARARSIAQFEDELTREYRATIAEIPVEALLGDRLDQFVMKTALPAFYRYFDLCNEQVFLRQHGRVTPRTWEFWVSGMRGNMQRPAFEEAWADVATRAPQDFAELRWLGDQDYRMDPRRSLSRSQRVKQLLHAPTPSTPAARAG